MGKAGLNCTGSKHLQTVFHKYKAEFEEAAKLDEKSLKDARQEAAPPPPVTQNSSFSHILTQQSIKVKKLEQHLPIMETKQVLGNIHKKKHVMQSAVLPDPHLFDSSDPSGLPAAWHSDSVDTMGRPQVQAQLLAGGHRPVEVHQQTDHTPETQAAPPSGGDFQDCSVQVPDGQGD